MFLVTSNYLVDKVIKNKFEPLILDVLAHYAFILSAAPAHIHLYY